MSNTAVEDPSQAALAAEEARRRLGANPRDADAYRVLARALRDLGQDDEARAADIAAIEASQFDPEIARASEAMRSGDVATAERLLRSALARQPDDVAAMRMLAEIAIRGGHAQDAERILRRAVGLAPGFEYARFTLAYALEMLGRSGEALAELNRLSGPIADRNQTIGLKAGCLWKTGDAQGALELYRELARREPQVPDFHINIADLRKILGDQDAAIAGYRDVLKTNPTKGEAWWGLANMKTVRFSPDDQAAMKAALESGPLPDDDRLRIHFALGKALEDAGEDEGSFDHYREGNRIRSLQTSYHPSETTQIVEQTEPLFRREFVEAHANVGSAANDPIFIIGMPRAGSTLIEQILASHPLVEGTGELPDALALALEVGANGTPPGAPSARTYLDVFPELQPEDFRRLGDTYIDRTRIQRKTDRPFFTDKMPNNWLIVGFIETILPNAKIVDARRHPLACGFSNFKQNYGRGQEFSYDLEHFGLYYRDYLRLMAHFDEVSPGKVHRVTYEKLLADPEAEVRRLLDHVGLPFDDACLRFYENKRPIRTASSEQVRRPISAESAEQWRRFDPWLEPLRKALGPALDSWDD